MSKTTEKEKLIRSFSMMINFDYEMQDGQGALVDKYNPFHSAFTAEQYLDNNGNLFNAKDLFFTSKGIPLNSSLAVLTPEVLFEMIEYKFRLEVLKRCQAHFKAFYDDSATFDYDYIYLIFHDRDVSRWGDSESTDIHNMNLNVKRINDLFKTLLKDKTVSQTVTDFQDKADKNIQALQAGQAPPFPDNDTNARNFLINTFYTAYPDEEKFIDENGLIVSFTWRNMIYKEGCFVREVRPLDYKYSVVEVPEIGYRKVTYLKSLHAHLLAHSILSDETIIDKTKPDCLIQRAKGQFQISRNENIEKLGHGFSAAFGYLTHDTLKAYQELKTRYRTDEIIVFAQFFSHAELTDRYGADFAEGHRFHNNSREIKATVNLVEGSGLFNWLMDYRNNSIYDRSTLQNRILFDELILKRLGKQTKRDKENNKFKELGELIEHLYHKLEYDPFYTVDNAHAACMGARCFYKNTKTGTVKGETLYTEYEKTFKSKFENKQKHLLKYFKTSKMSRQTVFIGGDGGIGKSEFMLELGAHFSRKSGFPDGSSIYDAPVKSKGKTFDPLGSYLGELVFKSEEARGWAYGVDEILSLFDPLHCGRTSSRNKDKDGCFSTYNLLCNSFGLFGFLTDNIKTFLYNEVVGGGKNEDYFSLLTTLVINGNLKPASGTVQGLRVYLECANSDIRYEIELNHLMNEHRLVELLKNRGAALSISEKYFFSPIEIDWTMFNLNITDEKELFDLIIEELGGFPICCVHGTDGYTNYKGVGAFAYADTRHTAGITSRCISSDLIDKVWQLCRRFGLYVYLYKDGSDSYADIYVLNYDNKNKYGYLLGSSISYYYEKRKTGIPISENDYSALISALDEMDDYYYTLNGFYKIPYPDETDIYTCVHGVLDEVENNNTTPPPVNSNIVLFRVPQVVGYETVVDENGVEHEEPIIVNENIYTDDLIKN